ncbi:MAG: hypothetical protein JWM86_1779 [Thermoleophilia bacterium]|nr:hypothetical protein [Thermoleophilia bacterium]
MIPAPPASADSTGDSPAPDFRALFEAAPSLLLVVTPGLEIAAASDAFLRASMTERAEILGRSIFDVFPDNPDDPDASGERNLRASFERVIATGVADTMELQKYDIRNDSSGEFEERVWRPRNMPVFGDDGSLAYILQHVEDVTDIARLQASGDQLEHDLDEVREPARIAAAEYRRALLDYTQLVRHRLANPLTAITAGVSTLRDLDAVIDTETRLEILDAMSETAARLERAVLHPELDTGVEAELKAIPEVDADLAGLIEVVAVKAEQHSREINQKLADQLQDFGARTVEVFCECWAPQCKGTMSLRLRDYYSIHRREDQFVICPGHDLPSIEDVVERTDEYWVVRKTPEAMQAAADDDH